jgi:gamma-glutamyltranspeptidase/glutathione hydrolase
MKFSPQTKSDNKIAVKLIKLQIKALKQAIKKGLGIGTLNSNRAVTGGKPSKIGTYILKKGGNAFDAMVATELVLAVTYPYTLFRSFY